VEVTNPVKSSPTFFSLIFHHGLKYLPQRSSPETHFSIVFFKVHARSDILWLKLFQIS